MGCSHISPFTEKLHRSRPGVTETDQKGWKSTVSGLNMRNQQAAFLDGSATIVVGSRVVPRRLTNRAGARSHAAVVAAASDISGSVGRIVNCVFRTPDLPQPTMTGERPAHAVSRRRHRQMMRPPVFGPRPFSDAAVFAPIRILQLALGATLTVIDETPPA